MFVIRVLLLFAMLLDVSVSFSMNKGVSRALSWSPATPVDINKRLASDRDGAHRVRSVRISRELSFSAADQIPSLPEKASALPVVSSSVNGVSANCKAPLKKTIKRTGKVIRGSISPNKDKIKPDMKGFGASDTKKKVIPALVSSPVKINILEKTAKKKNESSESLIKVYSNKDSIPYKIRDMFLDDGFNNFDCQAFVCNQAAITTAMKTAVEKGKKVAITVGPHAANKMDSYTVTSVKRDPNMHGKNLVAFDVNPQDGSPKKYAFFGGSANWSDNVWDRGNKELTVKVVDKEFCKEAHRLITSTSPVKSKKMVVERSPKKMRIYSSKHVKLNESRAKRIEKVADESDDDRSILYSTMNINDETVTDALCSAAKSGADTRIIVHKSALTSNGIPLLKKIEKAGGIVSVYYPDQGSHKINHSKYLVRNGSLLSVGNANTTQEGDDQKNLEMYLYDKDAIADAKKFHYETEKECIPLTNALMRNEEDTKKRKERQKARAEANKKAAEDKKKKDAQEGKSDDSKGTADAKTKKSLKRKAASSNTTSVSKKVRT